MNMRPQAVKKHMSSVRREIIFKPTPDNWYPNCEGGKVEIRIAPIEPGKTNKKEWYISVWGAGDFGLNYRTDSKQDALAMFEKLRASDFITKDKLIELGFSYI